MPGGTLDIEFAPEGHILMSGPVQPVFEGQLHADWKA
jgi:diaminopimelate epimerase